MAHKRKRVPAESTVPDQKTLIELMVLACEENGIATSSTEKLPGVKGPWLHNIKNGRQASTDVSNIFPLLQGLGLEMVIRVKRRVAKTTNGQQAKGRLLAERARKRAQAVAGSEPVSGPPAVALTESERMEAAAALDQAA